PRKWEKIIVEIFTNRGPVTVTHSAGFPGRNVTCGLMKGRELERGGRYAVIASGARTDLYLPPDTEPCAAEGGNVFAGRTVLALINHGGR
ncbi:MAG: phosphatidylserine decarboxylase, partial [Aminobacteriaceae bacterium]